MNEIDIEKLLLNKRIFVECEINLNKGFWDKLDESGRLPRTVGDAVGLSSFDLTHFNGSNSKCLYPIQDTT